VKFALSLHRWIEAQNARYRLWRPLTAAAMVCAVALSAASIHAQTTSSPATASAPAVDDRSVQSNKLAAAGIEAALRGQFAVASETLADAAKADPDNSVATRAEGLVHEYLARADLAKQERFEEYNATVGRIRLCFLAQEYFHKLDEAGITKDLRQAVREDLDQAYQQSGDAGALSQAQADEAVEMKKVSLEQLDRASKAVGKAANLIERDDSRYGETFREVAGVLAERLKEYRGAWESIDPETPAGRHAGARNLRRLDPKLAEAVADVRTMVAEKPWRLALGLGERARKLATDKEKVAQEQWYQRLVRDAERKGKEFVAKGEWSDALQAYVGLKDLEPGNETYTNEVKKAQHHVRVLHLYGSKSSDEQVSTAEPSGGLIDNGDGAGAARRDDPSTGGAVSTAPPEDNRPTWQKMVEGVDEEMVRKAIARLGGSYVSAVDFRKITLGALGAVKILAETPEAAATFEGLSDENKSKRDAFIAAIDAQIRYVEGKDYVDHIELRYSLKELIDASERTGVNIPLQVLAVEFADGFLSELDRFSSMIWPSDWQKFEKMTMGHFHGVGIQITKEENEPLKVVTPLLNTPAFKAGIKTGDLIVKVDGADTRGLKIDTLVDMIMGPKNTTVTLTIRRRGREEPFDVEVERAEINIRTVKGWRREKSGDWDYVLKGDSGIGYIRVTQFTRETNKEIATALSALNESGVRSMVLDLRFNPGGLLSSARDVADQFLSAGKIVSTSGRQAAPEVYSAQAQGNFLKGDLVVLVNEYSASASEIVSGALKDWRRATIVGQRTYGKGSVQNLITIRDKRAYLKLTTSYYYLPSGRLIHRANGAKDWGVDPDIEVFSTTRQTRRWMGMRSKTELLQDFDETLYRQDLDEQFESDIQLNTAVLLLELMKLQEVKPAA